MNTKEFNENLNRLQRKDYTALEEIYNEYYSLLYITAYSICNNKADAEDIADSVIHKLIRLNDIPYIDNPKGYLYTLAINAAKNHVKQQRDISLAFAEQCETQMDFDSRLNIEECLAKLTDIEKTIVIEYVFAGYKFHEIAKRHNISLSTVKRKYKKAKEFLQAIMK